MRLKKPTRQFVQMQANVLKSTGQAYENDLDGNAILIFGYHGECPGDANEASRIGATTESVADLSLGL